MAETEIGGWRDKYLQALEDHEHLRHYEALLRRAVLRVCVAADGLDRDLDRVLCGLRDALRHKVSHQQLERYMLVVEDAVTAFEKRRRQRSSDALQALQRLCKQLQSLNDLPADVQNLLKRFKGSLKPRLEHLQEYPPLLEEFCALQADALKQVGAEKPGFWQRWTARRQNSSPECKSEHRHDADENGGCSATADRHNLRVSNKSLYDTQIVGQPFEQAAAVPEFEFAPLPARPTQSIVRYSADGATVIEGQFQPMKPLGAGTELSLAEAIFERPVHEPAFSKISDKVTRVLTELLDNVEQVECVEQKVSNARQRIERGLNWYELVPTLEDVRDLVMQAYLAANRAFEEYLAGIDAELEGVCQALGIVVNTEVDIRRATEDLQDDLRGQVKQLQTSLADTHDLETLKTKVTQHINSIQSALDRFAGGQHSAEQPLAQQLQALVKRVESMEAEAKKSQRDLEAQRRKALQDPLTELPNREAYNERAYLEYQRWKRYRHSLSLVVCDIDFFKTINDNYGHQAGDRVLKVLSRAIAKRLREVDFIARYGGEEFVILMPDTAAATAFQTLDKIRAAIAQTPFHFREQPVQITLSMGVAEFRDEDTLETVFARADEQLYRAKEQGRNRCLLAD